MSTSGDDQNWTAVIARCLAYLCLQKSAIKDKSTLEKAEFLERLGLPLQDQADVIGSSLNSLQVLISRKKGGKRNGERKRR